MEEDELSKYVGTMPKYVYQEENKSGITIKELPNHDYDPGFHVTTPPKSNIGFRLDESGKIIGTFPAPYFDNDSGFHVTTPPKSNIGFRLDESGKIIGTFPSPFPRDYDPGMLATIPPNSNFGVRLDESGKIIGTFPAPDFDYDPGMLATIPPNSNFGVRLDESGKVIGTIPILHNNGDPGMAVPYTYPSTHDRFIRIDESGKIIGTIPILHNNGDPGMAVPYTGPNYDPGMAVPYTYPSTHDRFIRIDESGKIIGTIPILHNNSDPGMDVPRTYPSIIDNQRNTVFQTYPQRYPNLERIIIPNDPGMAVPYTGPNYDPEFLIPSTGPHYDPGFLIPSTGPHYDPGFLIPSTGPHYDPGFLIPSTGPHYDPGMDVPYTYPNSITLPDHSGFITIETEDGPKMVPYGHNPTRSNLVDYVRIDPETGEIRHYAKVEYLYEGYYDPETKQYIENPKYEYVETTGHVTLLKNYANIDDAIGALGNFSIEDLDLELIKTGNWTAKYESLLSDVQSIIDFFEGTDSMFSDIDGELGKSLLENFNISKEELENIKQYVSNNLSTVTELLEQLKQKIIEAEGIEEDKAAKELEKQSLLSNQPREYNPCTHKNAEGKTLHPGGDRNAEYDVWQNEVNAINAEIADLENDLLEIKKEQEICLQKIRELNNTTIV